MSNEEQSEFQEITSGKIEIPDRNLLSHDSSSKKILYNNPSDIFLTDKVQFNNDEDNKRLQKNIEFDRPVDNKLNDILFNKLIINITADPNIPRSIDPLFFIINGERPIEKEKCLNYNFNPHFRQNGKSKPNITDTNYMTMIEEQNDAIHQKNVFNKQHHDAFKTFSFEGCFNKCDEERAKMSTDIKKLIFSSSNNAYEKKVGAIKDLTRTEMIMRSTGRGIFLYNSKFHKLQHKDYVIKNTNIENTKKDIKINLRKPNYFEKKKPDHSTNVFFARTYMKMTYEDYKKIQKEKSVLRTKTKTFNEKIHNLYEKPTF